MMPSPAFHMELHSRISEFGPMARALQAWLEAAGAPAGAIRDATLMLDELFTNIVMHGYRGRPDGWVELLAEVRGASLFLTLRDRAPAFDPRSVSWPSRSSPLEERSIGGLGLVFVHRLADELGYRRVPDAGGEGMNELRITRHFAQPADAGGGRARTP